LVEAGLNAEAFSHDGYQDIDRYRDPDLRFHRVLAHAVKGFDAQMLLDPAKQQGDILPINIVPMKSRSTIHFTRCARTSCL
jgi:hypothetical protein